MVYPSPLILTTALQGRLVTGPSSPDAVQVDLPAPGLTLSPLGHAPSLASVTIEVQGQSDTPLYPAIEKSGPAGCVLPLLTSVCPWQCEKCKVDFRHKSQLRLHLRQKHGAITNTKTRYQVLNRPYATLY